MKKEEGSSAADSVADVTDVTDFSPKEEGSSAADSVTDVTDLTDFSPKEEGRNQPPQGGRKKED